MKCIIRAETAVQFGVQYLTDFIFNVTFNLHRWWWWLVSEWKWVWCGNFYLGYVDNGVDCVELVGELEGE